MSWHSVAVVKEWMSDPFAGPPLPGDHPGICVYGFGNGDWDVFCEHCGFGASEIADDVEANRVADAHLLNAHGIAPTSSA